MTTTVSGQPQHWITRVVSPLLWMFIGSVFLFGLFNLFVYLFVPVDGAQIWVRQGPIEVVQPPPIYDSPLQQGDIILTIQEQTLSDWLSRNWRMLGGVFARVGEHAPVTEMTTLRNSERVPLTVPLDNALAGIPRYQFLVHLFISYAFLIAGVLILKGGTGSQAERLAVLIMVLLALLEQNEMLLIFGAEWAWATLWLFITIRLLTRWFAYSSALHFSLVFPAAHPWFKRLPQLAWFIHLLNPVVTLVIMGFTVGDLQARHAAAYTTSKNIYIVFLLLTCLLLVRSYLTAEDSISRNQLRWIAWGAAMAVLPNVLLGDLAYVVFGIRLIPQVVSSLLLVFIPISVAVAVLRYRLWNIEVIIRASLLYGSLTVLLAVVYMTLVSFLIALLGALSATEQEATVYFLSALLVAFLFTPARDYLQKMLDRIFFKRKLDYARLITELSRVLSTSLLLDDLLALLNEAIPADLQLRGAHIILQADLPESGPVYDDLMQGKLIWLHRQQPTSSYLEPFQGSLQLLGRLQMWACVALLSGDKVMGLYGLGAKKSGDYYSPEDIVLLETIARQAGVALQNAQLHRQLANRARLQRDLEIASQIQTSLLPRQDPQVAGLDVVSYSRPAQKVGGDFYHYVAFDNGQLGIIVGDVSGKGVPAAMFMAIAISTLRAQLPHYASQPAALLTAVNEILYSQMSISAVNSAMLYAIINREPSGELSLEVSNAGLIWPVLHRTGVKTEYIDVSGLPIGAIQGACYGVERFQLCPGDLLIISSDGVVEAQNSQREMFGFERLEQSVRACTPHDSAADAVQKIKDDVFDFIGNAEPHDDITLITIRIC